MHFIDRYAFHTACVAKLVQYIWLYTIKHIKDIQKIEETWFSFEALDIYHGVIYGYDKVNP